MRVADKIASWLTEKGIRHAFGIIGAGNVAIFDALASAAKIKIIPCHHEQAAAMAATYYFRTSGTLAPVLVTTGAGSSNSLTGVLAAYMDSIPLLVIAGNEPLPFFGTPHSRVVGVQGYASAALARPITKYAAQAQTPMDVMTILNQCYEEALQPRQGPCWAEIPRNLQVASCK